MSDLGHPAFKALLLLRDAPIPEPGAENAGCSLSRPPCSWVGLETSTQAPKKRGAASWPLAPSSSPRRPVSKLLSGLVRAQGRLGPTRTRHGARPSTSSWPGPVGAAPPSSEAQPPSPRRIGKAWCHDHRLTHQHVKCPDLLRKNEQSQRRGARPPGAAELAAREGGVTARQGLPLHVVRHSPRPHRELGSMGEQGEARRGHFCKWQG